MSGRWADIVVGVHVRVGCSGFTRAKTVQARADGRWLAAEGVRERGHVVTSLVAGKQSSIRFCAPGHVGVRVLATDFGDVVCLPSHWG